MTPTKASADVDGMRLIYHDTTHAYYLNGRRVRSISAVAKIPVDNYALQLWSKRQVAIGMTIDAALREKVAVDLDNRDAINEICETAMETAKAHTKADRGTQMHRVLELSLLDREQELITEQQHRDAETLRRTLDRYKLTPHDGLVEHFVAWPGNGVVGRFDAILEHPDGRLRLTDLKTGPNAITYPHATAVQLALYAKAEHVSDHAEKTGDKTTVERWRAMPDRLDRETAYVLLVEPDSNIGTLHEIDIEHGWRGARFALDILQWRKRLDNGKGMVREHPEPSQVDHAPPTPAITAAIAADPLNRYINARGQTLAQQIATHQTLGELRAVWNAARENGLLTTEVQAALKNRAAQVAA